jgi:beta-phosphoglucomutase-like phosphatase (HAD superfamily)/ribosomal protein S18 acetylase RimI-like enzyme
MLYEAIYLPPETPRPPREIVNHPDLAKYVSDWGQSDDAGVLALDPITQQPIGAAWFRLFTEANRGYGYVDDSTPELTIAVLPEYRGKGIGSQLLARLLEIAQTRYAAISLSVVPENPALRLYQHTGFKEVGRYGTSLTMLKVFDTYTGIIFDFNGVLLWDTDIQEQTWVDFSTKLRGVPLSQEEIRDYVHGRPNKVTLEYITGKALTPDETHRLSQEKETLYRQRCLTWEGFTLSPGARELLDFLVERHILHTIATASEQINVRFFIEHLELAKWFDPDKIVLDDGILPGKPAPDIYLRAAENIGLAPAECVVVEDSVSGICAAHRAGVGKIYALGPKEKHEELRNLEGVSKVITHLGEISTNIFETRP